MNKLDFSKILNDNEKIANDAFNNEDYIKAFLLLHALIESLLRQFLKETDDEITFSQLIKKYDKFLENENYSHKTFSKELVQFNKRRNRIVHQLWIKGYTDTNKQAKPAAEVALTVYGLFIEFLETWDPDITKFGFQYI